jgi:hypothetical protein
MGIPLDCTPLDSTPCATPVDDDLDDTPKDECGVLGVSTPHGEGVAQLAFFGLFALQHRGQEAAGIAVSDGQRARVHKEAGLVANVFNPATLAPLTGYHAIGHTRYSTTGSNAERNIQPFLVETMHGPLALAHNGNVVNAPTLRDELLNRGFGLTATSDSEVMTLMLAAAGGQTWEERIERTLPAWKGAFSLVLLAADRVIAVRDPWGFRPLSVGRLPTAATPSPRRPAPCRRSAASTSTRCNPARWSRCAAPSCTVPRCWHHNRAAPTARSSSCTSRDPIRCGTAATCTTCASVSVASWPRRRPPMPTW